MRPIRRPIRAVLFDWGGTLMREVGGLDGPIAEWPPIEAIPGAKETLRALHDHYALAVATNARLSDESHVRKALARAELDRYFALVVTARDLGVAKPDPAFFRSALDRLGFAPGEAVMIGDSYEVDIVGAKAAGLRAIWFNPAGVRCPTVHPGHDAEIQAIDEIPAVLERRWLPDIAVALKILRTHEVPPNIVRHSLTVAAVAHHFAVRLREQKIAVEPVLVHRGGLLHDLDKLSSERPAEHGMKAGRVLRALGQPALAGIAERHVLGAVPVTWEEKLVHYADKIVEDDRVAGLTERLNSLAQRYPAEADRVSQALPFLLGLEKEILSKLPAPRGAIMAELRRLDLSLPSFVIAGDPAYDSSRERRDGR
ncbi:TPA: hypothetical protein DCY67_01185 [Candidatus Acetothermia bacterium]|nr:hypothetical protein [Candidatus Acetothermia bacterium]